MPEAYNYPSSEWGTPFIGGSHEWRLQRTALARRR
jgi:hypothetical protein